MFNRALCVVVLMLIAQPAFSWKPPIFLGQWPAPEPFAIATSGSSEIYVANAGVNRVQKFASDGSLLGQWASSGCRSIAVDSQGYVYVTDVAFNKINKFSPDGMLLVAWPLQSTPGGIAVGVDDVVFIASRSSNEILAFATNGTLITRWGTTGVAPGQFFVPTGIACDQAGRVYVFDTGNARIQVFNRNGVFEHLWYLSWFNTGSDVGIHVSTFGSVYVPEVAAHRIWVYDTAGNTLGQWGAEGAEPGFFRSPYDISDDPLGMTYVADLANQRIQKFRVDEVVAVMPSTWGQIKLRLRQD